MFFIIFVAYRIYDIIFTKHVVGADESLGFLKNNQNLLYKHIIQIDFQSVLFNSFHSLIN